jgi:hypothetical protein
MRQAAAVLLLLFAIAVPASAQDAGNLGAVMGYPASIGLLWDVNERVGLRPEISLSGGSAEVSSSTNITIGASALFYLPTPDQVRTYVSPRVTFGHSSLSPEGEFSSLAGDVSTNTISFTGSLGAEYRPHPRFGIFGELGFGFSHSSTSSDELDVDTSGNQWGTRTAVGIIVRF